MEGEKMAYKMMNQDFVKLDKFDGSNFIHWHDKMKFLLTALKIFYVLDPNLQLIPDPTPQDTEQLKQQRIKREEDELVCRGHILNTLSDRLYDLFTTMTSPKEIWKALETKYKTKKQGTDKFIIQKYFDFKMMDNVSVLDQVHELQILVHKLNDLSIKIPELFQVGAIIAKLPPSWNNYRKKLLHMAEELTLEQISTHLKLKKRVEFVRQKIHPSRWYDSGATIHVCNNKMLFKEYVEADNGLKVLMGNHNTAKVLGTGTVELILSSGKKLKLTNVYHVPDIKKNLVSTSLLSKNGVKAVLESDKLILSKCGNREKVLSKLPFVGNVEEDPNTYSEAMASRDATFWREAVNDEMNSILSNNTWVLVDLPPSSNTIGCKWVFRRKYRTDGTIQTFKTRLVAKGFRQREGIYYFDTYAPVARITSIRVLIALASIYKLVVHQMDVKTAFLNGDLDEEVYMDQLEGFVLPGNEKKVCKLVKSLYGLKQAPKQWHEKFDTVILANGFKHNGADKCVYSKFTSEYGVIVCLYVDDMLFFGTNMLGVCETKKYLASVFKMEDLNEADTILGVNVKRHSESYALCQSHYIEKGAS
uniref:Uncharacterized protein n=1 Tax=Fagus sylvatica TaxID=28930 RepID=A0A2N9GCP6_FAGSY